MVSNWIIKVAGHDDADDDDDLEPESTMELFSSRR